MTEGNVPRVETFDPLDPEVLQCPYTFYKALHRDAPVHKPENAGFYMVTRYADIQEILKKPEIFSNDTRGVMSIPAELNDIVLPAPALTLADLPVHKRSRSLVNGAFTASRVNAMEPYIQGIIDELIDTFIAEGSVNLTERFSIPLPMTVISDQLGVPRSDLPDFKKWSDSILLAFSLAASPEERLEAGRQVAHLNEYVLRVFREKRTNPTNDIISDLATATLPPEAGGPLTDLEFCTIVQLLLVGGNETTTSTIDSCLLLLLKNPQALEQVKQDPRKTKAAIEETLRMESPARSNMRVAKQDTEVGGVRIPAGSLVNLVWAAGNRDECKFANPDVFDVSRPQIANHLAFGGGLHFCVGSLLAKKESEIAVRTLLRRLPNLSLSKENSFEYSSHEAIRQLRSLHLTFDRTASSARASSSRK